MAKLFVQLKAKLYPCEIIDSKRARYLRIKLSPAGILSVVVPIGVSRKVASDFVDSQVGWIERNLAKLTSSKQLVRPSNLNLLYLNEHWAVEYLPRASSSVKTNVVDNLKIECLGKVDDLLLLHKALGQWLKYKAEPVITSRLAKLAEVHGFHFNRVTIRGQKTRWGSCSSKKNISLNYKLLFLEPEIVDYVLIHELCHTVEMNHSRRFWDLVADCDENYRMHDKQLTKRALEIPL